MAQWSHTPPRRPQSPGQASLSHEPLTINKQLINEIFNDLLKVLNIN